MSYVIHLIKRLIKFAICCIWQIITSIFLVSIAFIARNRKKTKFIFGSTPIINNKYWANAIKNSYDSITIMKTYYSINKKEDFDFYFKDFIPKIFQRFSIFDGKYCSLIYVLWTARVLHMSFDGFALTGPILEKLEPLLFKLAQCKIVLLPYGGDVYIYSAVNDLSLRNVLIGTYPHTKNQEEEKIKKVRLLLKHCDIYISGAQVDGIHHWNVSPFNMLCIDTQQLKFKNYYSLNNGKGKIITIVHAPNHRLIKGTEFLIDTINSLKEEGYKINFILLEKKQNTEVLKIIRNSDIFVDQLIMGYYGFAAIEGMSLGTTVICNLENNEMKTVLRRYSFLNECPIVSATPETIKEVLKILITYPELREELGKAGRQYVEKYHSYRTAQYLFGSIYDKIIYNKEVDLMNLFHPLLSSYNQSSPLIKHPLINNQLPEKYFKEIV